MTPGFNSLRLHSSFFNSILQWSYFTTTRVLSHGKSLLGNICVDSSELMSSEVRYYWTLSLGSREAEGGKINEKGARRTRLPALEFDSFFSV